MKQLKWKEKAGAWMRKCGKKPFSAAGVWLDGNAVTVGYKINDRQFMKTYEMKYKGIEGFYVPMSLMDMQCEEGLTNKKIFCKFLSGTIRTIRNDLPQGNLLIILPFPERKSWKRDADSYAALLNEIFANVDENISPLFIPVSDVIGEDKNVRGRVLIMSVEREWTEFTLKDHQGIVEQTSAHIGISPGEKIMDPVCLRMNDYLNNSTEVWDELRADSKIEAFRMILQGLYSRGWSGIREAHIICPDQLWDGISQFMMKEKIHVVRVDDVAIRAIHRFEKECGSIGRTSISGPKQISYQAPKQEQQKADNIWKL